MKVKLRKSLLFLLLATVLAPIIIYTDILGAFFTSSSSRDEFVEDVSTFMFPGEIRPLNVLPQESSTPLKEPLGIVYSENTTKNGSSISNGSTARITRQLTGEDGISTLSSLRSRGNGDRSSDDSLIRQLAGRGQEAREIGTAVTKQIENVKNVVNVKEDVLEKMELKKPRHTSNITGNVNLKEQVKIRSEKPREETLRTDVRIHQLKDQLLRAKVYLSLSGNRNNPHFIRELRVRMKEIQRTLGGATKDSELPKNSFETLKAMEQTLLKGKQIQHDCAAVVKKLRAMVHLADEQFRIHKKQALFLMHLTAKTVPKGLHCLPLRLSTEYFLLNSSQQQLPNKENLNDPNLYHYALFSDNVLASAVVVNSTITHAKDPSKHVFHIVTDRLNYAAMKMWFLANPPGKATIQVQNVEEFTWLNSSYSPVIKQLGSPSMMEYYFKNSRSGQSDSNLKFRNPKYLSVMNHLRFYLPEIFPKLNKVLFLDDDIVVHKDLTSLWSVDLRGKVVGVIETCGENFHRFDRYLNFSNPLISQRFNPRACGWAFGMNIFDLDKWRNQNITQVYHKWQNLNHDRLLWKLGTLPPGLITFWNHTYTLDKYWHVLGLGYNPNVSQNDIDRAAVIHYNGNLKPWLEIAIPKFRNYWAKYVDYDQQYLHECNITP